MGPFQRHALRTASLLVLAGITGNAWAQEAPAADEESEAVIVTGSRIARTDLTITQPLITTDGQQMQLRGQTYVSEALDDIPAFGVPGATRAGSFSQMGPFSTGQSFANLFGLGDQRTLTLVNGHRFVSSNTASIFGPTGNGSQVDLNLIPTLMIDRIETVAVGGAPVYGSDAIAGTVNIITKKRFEGIAFDGQYGLSSRADAADYRLGGAAGTSFADGRGHVALFVEHSKARGLTNADRPGHRLNSTFGTPADPAASFALGYIADRRYPGISAYGVPSVADAPIFSPSNAALLGAMQGFPFPFQVGITDNPADPLSGNPLAFNRNGELVPIDFGKESGDFLTSDGGSGFVTPGSLLTPSRRYLATMVADYELTDAVRLYGEGWYANSKGTQAAGQPEYNSVLFGDLGTASGNLVISLDNPYLSDQARSLIAANLAANPLSFFPDRFLLGRANTDLISGKASTTTEVYRFVGGVDGDFEALGRRMTFDVGVNYGKSVTQGDGRAIVFQNLFKAVNAVEVGGVIQCADMPSSSMPTFSSTCVPINPFGDNVSQAARDFVTARTDPRSESDQLIFSASVTGSLFDLGAGPVGFALGYEHRRETASFDPGRYFLGDDSVADPDPTVDTNGDGIPDNDPEPYGSSVTMSPVAGGFNTDELFGELTIPVISADQNIPLVHALSFSGAFRYIDHSLAGGDPTYTLGATWQPLEALTLRGNYTRSVRAPAITEFQYPRNSVRTTAVDPCDVRYITGGPNPAVRQANCAAAGVPANFLSQIDQVPIQGTFAGNPDLRNEKANSWTVGGVLRPAFLQGFSLSVDWVDIKVRDAVEGLTATNVLSACYDAAGTASNVYCGMFTRNANGHIVAIATDYRNAAERNFEGLVAKLDWTIPTAFLGADSAVRLGANYFYNHKLNLKVGVSDQTTLTGGIGYARHQAVVSATYLNGGFTWQWQANYTGKAKVDPDAAAGTYEYPTVDDVVFVNSSVRYQATPRLSLNLAVDNVFDTKQPWPAPAGGGTVAYFDGILGRYMKIGVGVGF